MKIAILGSRGIPARYSGFETCAEELGKRLVERGHEVTTYCCAPYSATSEKYYNGVRRVILPTIKKKSIDKILYSILCLLHVSFTKNQIVLMLGLNFPMLFFFPKLFGKKVAINVDGLEWKRQKWQGFASRYLLFSEKVAVSQAHRIITDAKCIYDYYYNTYGFDSTLISYGVEMKQIPPGDTLSRFGLEKDKYILYVSRFAPENNPLLVREAFEKLENPSKKLVMVGDSPFDPEYVMKIKDTKHPDIVFTGAVYGDGYKELQSNAYLYIQATEVGGTHPALVEAMGYGNFVLANDVPEHREVLQDAGEYYAGQGDLVAKLDDLMCSDEIVKIGGAKAQEITKVNYSWDSVCDHYEVLFQEMLDG